MAEGGRMVKFEPLSLGFFGGRREGYKYIRVCGLSWVGMWCTVLIDLMTNGINGMERNERLSSGT